MRINTEGDHYRTEQDRHDCGECIYMNSGQNQINAAKTYTENENIQLGCFKYKYINFQSLGWWLWDSPQCFIVAVYRKQSLTKPVYSACFSVYIQQTEMDVWQNIHVTAADQMLSLLNILSAFV